MEDSDSFEELFDGLSARETLAVLKNRVVLRQVMEMTSRSGLGADRASS